MADEVEGIEVLVQFLDDGVERQTLGRQFLDDRLLALLGLPAPQEIVEAGEALFQRLAGEVAQGFGDQPAVLVEVLHPLGNDCGVDSVHVNLVRAAEGVRQGEGRVMDDNLLVCRVAAVRVRRRRPGA